MCIYGWWWLTAGIAKGTARRYDGIIIAACVGPIRRERKMKDESNIYR